MGYKFMDGTRKYVIVYLVFFTLGGAWAAESTYQAGTTADPEIAIGDLELLLKPLRKQELVIETEAWLSLLQAKVHQISLAEIGMKEKTRTITAKKEDLAKKIKDIREDGTAGLQEAPPVDAEQVIQEALKKREEVVTAGPGDAAQHPVADTNALDEAGRSSDQDVKEKAQEVAQAKEKLKLAVSAVSNADLDPEEKIKKLGDAELELHTKVKEQLLADINKLIEEQTALIDRVKVAIGALKNKGGEVGEYEKYLSAISGLSVDVNDVGAARAIILGWLKSPEGGLRWARKIVAFILIVMAAKILSVLLARLTRQAVNINKNYSDLLRGFLVNIVRKGVLVVGLVIALSMLGINIGPLVAGIGALGFIVGFALQGTLGNFAAGLMILTHRPYDVGDVVQTAGIMGFVQSMNLNTTTIKTFDNQVVVVPNGSIWGDNIINVTGSETRRVDMMFGIGYGDDIAKAQAIIEDILTSHELVLDDPAPVVKVHELGDSSVNFVCRPWTKTTDYWTVHWDVTRAVKERFDAEGVSIPFPQRDIHLIQETLAKTADVNPVQKHQTTITEVTYPPSKSAGRMVDTADRSKRES
jgi:small conductance mechanosensitive channel